MADLKYQPVPHDHGAFLKKATPSLATLKKYAKAVGRRLEIRLVPESYATRKRIRGHMESADH